MTAHDTAGFTIAFAHMNFQDNPDWEKAFDNAQNGDLNITSYPEYDFGDYNVKAPAQGAVYVVTPEVGYVVSDINHPQRAQITFVDSKKGATQPVYFRALAKKVAHSSCKKDVQNIGKKVKVSVQKRIIDNHQIKIPKVVQKILVSYRGMIPKKKNYLIL